MAKPAKANWENLIKVFTVPENDQSTLTRLEHEISGNIDGFLNQHVIAGDLLPEDIERKFSDTKIPDEPSFVAEQVQFLMENVVAQSVHVASPSFVGHMTSAMPYFMLPLAKIMIALNQNLVKIETSKAFTPLERQVIGMLHRLVFKQDEGFYKNLTHDANSSLGIIGSGGTTANMAALWVARNQLLKEDGAFQGVKNAGLVSALKHYGYSDLAILVSERGHYSLKKAADVLGIGRQNCIAIKTDDSNRIDLDELKNTIQNLRRDKVGILAVVGIAGSTETGSIDPLQAMAEICQKEKIHFHVDAAWGGPTLLSEKHATLLKGIELADSVTMDGHKQLYVPVGAGVVLFRDPQKARAIENHAHYIIRKGSRDLGRYSLEGSRPGIALLIYAALKILGRKGYSLLIEHGIQLAKKFTAMIESHPDFELMTKPELNLLCYRYCPKHWQKALARLDAETLQEVNEKINALTVRIQKAQRVAGKSFVSRTTIKFSRYQRLESTVFRVVLANPLTQVEHLQAILQEQAGIAVDCPELTEIDALLART